MEVLGPSKTVALRRAPGAVEPAGRERRRFPAGTIALLVAMLTLLAGMPARGQGVVASEWEVKAVLLYNLARFVEWPATAFAETNSPLVIGIVGSDPFGRILDDVVKGETIDGHPLAVRRFASVADVRNCHILYISTRDSAEVAGLIRSLKNRPILTVGETETFVRRDGGMVRLLPTAQGKIGLRINVGNARAAGLKVSSKLLRVAQVIDNPS